MYSLLSSTSASGSAGLVSYGTLFLVTFVSLFLPDLHIQNKDLYAGSTPSRTSGTPTRIAPQQENVSFATTGYILLFCVIISVLSGRNWARSPGTSGRLKRQGDPHPPPPPPPPPPPVMHMPAGEDADDDETNNRNGGDGDDDDDDPQQDGGVDGQNERAEDDLATGAAPAPEDPPPPPGGIEEDEDEDDDGYAYVEGGLGWLVFILMGSVLFRLVKCRWGIDIKSWVRKLLEQLVMIDGRSLMQMTRRRPAPFLLSAQQHDAVALDPAPPPVAAVAPSATSIHRQVHRLHNWRNAYVLLAAIPGLGFLAALIHLLVPVHTNNLNGPRELLGAIQLEPIVEHAEEGVGREEEEVVEEDDPEPPATPQRRRLPRTPPPSPISPRRQRPLAPLPFRDAQTQAACDNMVGLLRNATALRMARAEAGTNIEREGEAEKERKVRVREVQRKIWGLLCELREEGAVAQEV